MNNYYYNDIELPALPEWDKTTYPYAYITVPNESNMPASGATYLLYLCSVALVARANGAGTQDTQVQLWGYVDGEWVYSIAFDFVMGSTYTNDTIIWSNTNVYYKDGGELYLPASDPVPLVATLTARDLYKIINGKPTKLTLYKKLGGKLIPLDEHTKEVNHD